MTIYTDNSTASSPFFQPTFFYIKQHSFTGMLYCGITFLNPETYKGSGTYWKYHIKKHGTEHVNTLWYCLFTDEEELYKFCSTFSIDNNIVESKEWANLKIEAGRRMISSEWVVTEPVTIDGVTYKSKAIAARKLNVPYSRVYDMIANTDPKDRATDKKKPVTIDGITYKSIAYAAKALNVAVITITRRMSTESNITSESLKLRKKHKEPVTIDGVEYESVALAARQLGLSQSTLRGRLIRPRTPVVIHMNH